MLILRHDHDGAGAKLPVTVPCAASFQRTSRVKGVLLYVTARFRTLVGGFITMFIDPMRPRQNQVIKLLCVRYDFCSMTTYSRLRSMLLKLDHLIAQSGLAFTDSEGVLLSFLFHGLFDDSESETTGFSPRQGITVEMFACFVEYFQRHSYTFVSPNEVAHGLDSKGKYVVVTFDDGYFSNTKALPVLEHYGIPAALFVSTEHVVHGKAFWWDVIERESSKRRTPQHQVNQVYGSLKRLRTPDAEAFVQAEFGPRALRPLGDCDRPFTL